VIVFDFETGAADVRVVSSPGRKATRAVGLSVEEPDVLAEAVADVLSAQLVDQFKSLGLSAERAAGAALPDVNDLVIQGQFVRINEGSVTKRFVIGFGAGATELRTQVEVFQVTASGWEPVKQFDTVAQGARFPGAAFSVVGGAVAGMVVTSAIVSSGTGVAREFFASIDADARRTAEQIVKKISDLSTEHHW
jgi:hypothetical protein